MRGLSVAVLMLALTAAPAVPAFGQENSQPPASQAQEPAQQQPPANPATPGTGKSPALPASVDPHTYILGADDVIQVRVWREGDLSGNMAIRPDGKITMPLIHEIKAAGLTPIQLGDEITQALAKFINNPQVTVAVESVRSKRYFMSGEINRPGAYPLPVPTTIFEAITMAGGFREFANKKKVLIIRGNKRFRFNWNEMVKGKNTAQNINLENGDQVIVP